MLSEKEKKEITALVHREVVPAVGCTEPVCVALAVTRARELLGCEPERIDV
ncbi:MAG: serine dehydratase subunit alpha family protein, partial [Alloprevotella sp.]|nr:serine dehydratase subunit alpha family protein [Alloprevotella sp.]